MENKGLNILIQSTKRRNQSETGILEAGICHGSMSMAMIYRRMYIETKIKVFLDAVGYWMQESLKFSNFRNGVAGYKSYYMDGYLIILYYLEYLVSE